jgi:hypothetical protein
MPFLNPHAASLNGQPASLLTPMSAEVASGPLVASVVCAIVGGTYITVIVSVLNVRPRRRGSCRGGTAGPAQSVESAPCLRPDTRQRPPSPNPVERAGCHAQPLLHVGALQFHVKAGRIDERDRDRQTSTERDADQCFEGLKAVWSHQLPWGLCLQGVWPAVSGHRVTIT